MVIITGATQVIGLYGFPVEHSLSPAIHNAAFKTLGLNYCYAPFNVEAAEVATAVKAIRSLGMAGVNVTAPHKQAVIPYLDQLSPEAEFLNAVNTIVNEEGQLTGFNTDAQGYLAGLEYVLHEEEISQGRAVILGGGGAARAVAAGLAQGNMGQLTFALREPEKMQEWLGTFKGQYPEIETGICSLEGDGFKAFLRDATLIIYALPNLAEENSQDWFKLILAQVRPHTFFSDLRYAPPESPFLKMGMSLGCRVQNGLPLLVEQAALSFSLFTGEPAPLDFMRGTMSL